MLKWRRRRRKVAWGQREAAWGGGRTLEAQKADRRSLEDAELGLQLDDVAETLAVARGQRVV